MTDRLDPGRGIPEHDVEAHDHGHDLAYDHDESEHHDYDRHDYDHHDYDHHDYDHDGPQDEGWFHQQDTEAAHAGAPRRRPRRRGRGARTARRLLVLFVALALVAAAGFAALSVLRPAVSGLGESNDYAGPGSGSVQVVVNPGDVGRAIGATLERAGVVKSAKAFADAADENPDGGNIQPGTYSLPRQLKASDAVTFLLDPAHRSVPRLTLREGLWMSETFAELARQTGTPVADYQAAAKDPTALGLPAAAKGNVEGYLFPASYEFAPKATATDQLRAMVQKSVAELTSLGVTPEKMERTIIIASIIEAEGRRAADRPMIARVIENRLAAAKRLQLDSTVSYGAQKRTLTTTDTQRAAVNGYNTYQHDGLPVGPISNPGVSAIEAATAPAAGPWLFFVAVDPSTGETKFATTDVEHAKNVTQFQAWCAAHKGKC